MRILIYSRAFLPQIGGLELNVAHIAAQFVRRGHEIVVVTTTPGEEDVSLPYPVFRNPGPLALWRWMRWCDVFHHPNVSLRGFWPLILVRRPWVVAHHSWYCQSDGRLIWKDRLKRFLLRYAAGSIAVSSAVAADLATPCSVINNAYRDNLFRVLSDVDRSRDLVFVGRLVSDKGADLLVEALTILAERGQFPDLTVVGEGPERAALEVQARTLAYPERVRFLGTRTGEELVRILNQHKILVAPSRYNEPFGIVALEGIACGCVVVGSEGGGLKEAIGNCGRTFPNGNSSALASVLGELLQNPASLERCRSGATEHLAAHAAERVVERYDEVFEHALRHAADAAQRA